MTALVLGVPLLIAGGAVVQAAPPASAPMYEDDGAMQNSSGTWDMPGKGYCRVSGDPIPTRPECVATRFPTWDSSGCTTNGGSLTTATSRYCRDTVNNTAANCVDSAPDATHPNGIDRLWFEAAVPADSRCILTLKGYNRNQAVCQVQQGGTWTLWGAGKCIGAWNMPPSVSFTPPLVTSITNPGPGDQCLRCHRADTEWNTNRVRDTEKFLETGHKNMSRKVATPYQPWAGPGGHIYPSNDAGETFDWDAGTVGGSPVAWIFGNWLAPLPRTVKNIAGQSYTCGRCHTTGWIAAAESVMEPEKSFAGIRTNVSVTGSWDQFGITCARCHASASSRADGTCGVANLVTQTECEAAGATWQPRSAGNPIIAVPGKGTTHHADFTNFDAVNGGYCSDTTTRNANKYTCENLGGGATWYSVCSDDRWQTSTLCLAASACISSVNDHGLNFTTETACESGICSSNPTTLLTQAACEAAGSCSVSSNTTKAACEIAGAYWTPYLWNGGGECSIPFHTSQTACLAGGGTWTAADSGWWTSKTAGTWKDPYCSIGTCSVAGNTTQPACLAAGGNWTNTWSDLFACMDAGGKWTGTKERRGQLITKLCMDCHRQETGGNPYNNTAATGQPDPNLVNPGTYVKVGPAHGTVGPVSHPAGNMFLNSPHAKYGGTFANIGKARNYADGPTGYNSYFMEDGEAAKTGNGCTGCHDVHQSVVKETGHQHAIHEECTDCHTGLYDVSLSVIKHPSGPYTPLENMATKEAEACEICHMPHGQHLWRVNASGGYSTFPPAALTATVNANTTSDGAVWVDLDHSCGQCHGGGSNQATTTGTVAAGTKVLTVASSTGFAAGQKVHIAGAGALEADGITRGEFETYVVSVPNATTINLAGNVTAAVTGAVVKQNRLAEGVNYYFTKNQLVGYATGMHPDRTPAQGVVANFTATPTGLAVAFDGSASTCGGSAANCDTYTWDFGDGASATGVTASHTYGAAGTYVARLTVVDTAPNPDGTATATKTLTLAGAAPTASGTCSFNALTWTMTATNTSTVPNGMKQVVITWGQGLTTNDLTPTAGESYARKYVVPGTFPIDMSVLDNAGKTGRVRLCTTNPANFTYYSIAGTVQDSAAVGLSGATLKVYKAGSSTAQRTLTSGVGGAFNITGLAPGTYILIVTKTGTTFPSVPDQTVGGNIAGLVIQANP